MVLIFLTGLFELNLPSSHLGPYFVKL